MVGASLDTKFPDLTSIMKIPLMGSVGIVSLPVRLMVTLCLVGFAAGCVTSKTVQKQTERVAKDWCLVIRASQIIPVYPLTEDLVPGDVFLVEQTREEQVRQYHEAGFLPLDHHLARLRPSTYPTFYPGVYSISNKQFMPDNEWTLPDRARASTGTNSPANMPLAAFPSYSFEVTRSGGLKLAIPIQGINTALGLLGGASASGNVVLSEAVTYGMDEASLAEVIYRWGASNRVMLSNFAPSSEPPKYLRVVNRVYLVNSVEVGLTRSSALRAQARADVSPIESLDLSSSTSSSNDATNTVSLTDKDAAAKLSKSAAVNIGASLDALNESLGASPKGGGSVKFTSASSRAVAFSQQFPRPLVVGYVGYDIPLLPDGRLGPYSSTLQTLTGKSRDRSLHLKPVDYYYYYNPYERTNSAAGDVW